MGVPATTGQLKTNLYDMNVGDYIVCNYQASGNTAGTFSNFGGTAGTEIPVLGSATPNGTFYFIKVAKGLLIADRVVQYSVSWNTLNTGKLVQGKPWDMGNIIPVMTSNTAPSGVVDASSFLTIYNPWKAFDGNVSSVWQDPVASSPSAPQWISYTFPVQKVIRKYVLKANSPTDAKRPKAWTFEGSNDGVVWDVLDWFDNSGWTTSVPRLINNNKAYYSYRFKFTGTVGGASSEDRIGEIEMMETAGIVRSLTGGVAYADVNGNMSLTKPATDYGAFPTNNEYDTYIKRSTLGGKVAMDDDNVWHHKDIWCWGQDTPANGFSSGGASATSAARVCRGYDNWATYTQQNETWATSSYAASYLGFRPVLEYVE